jgi:hypothetical protein
MAVDTLHTTGGNNAGEDLSSTRFFGCDKVVFGTLIVSVVALLLPTLLLFRSKVYPFSHRRPTTTTTSSSSFTPPSSESHLVVPFIFLRDSSNISSRKPLEHTLRSAFTGYQRECSNAMTGLSKMLEMALVSETDRNYHDNIGNNKKNNNNAKHQKLLLSTKIERRIQQTAACIEHDEDILKQLLGNFSYVLALPDKPYNNEIVVPREDDANDRNNDILKEGRSTLFHLSDPRMKVMNESDSYDSATQIWAHLVRDWTTEGQKIRHIIYDWCYDQMEIYSFKSGSSVLVPGAGMGRLAYDLSQRGYHVEANELSPSMAAAASSILRNETRGTLHPYVLDAMSNEVDSKRRFGSVSFPDTSINRFFDIRGSLSYTVGSFVGENDDYYQRQRAGHFDAVVSSTVTIHTQLENWLLFIIIYIYIYIYTNFISLMIFSSLSPDTSFNLS